MPCSAMAHLRAALCERNPCDGERHRTSRVGFGVALLRNEQLCSARSKECGRLRDRARADVTLHGLRRILDAGNDIELTGGERMKRPAVTLGERAERRLVALEIDRSDRSDRLRRQAVTSKQYRYTAFDELGRRAL